MSVVDYQEKLRTKSCALFLKLRFWIPPCAKPAGREERQRDKAARLLPAEETRQKRERAHKTAVSSQTAPFAQSGSQAPLTGGKHSPILPAPQDPRTSSKRGTRGSGQLSPTARQCNARNPRHGQPAPQRLRGTNLLCQAGNFAHTTIAIPSSPAS